MKLTRTTIKMGHRLCRTEEEINICINDGSMPIIEWDESFWEVEL